MNGHTNDLYVAESVDLTSVSFTALPAAEHELHFVCPSKRLRERQQILLGLDKNDYGSHANCLNIIVWTWLDGPCFPLKAKRLKRVTSVKAICQNTPLQGLSSTL